MHIDVFWQQIWGFGGEPALSSFLLLQRPSHTQSASSARFSSRGSRPVTLTLSPWTRPGPLCCLVSYLLTQGSVLRCSDCTAHLHWATKRRRRRKKKTKASMRQRQGSFNRFINCITDFTEAGMVRM